MSDPQPGSARDPLLFLKKFLREGTRVASVVPSSPALAAAMCRQVDPDRPQVVVELGAGTGAVTRAVAARLHPDSKLLAVEIDPEFAAILEREVPRATVLLCDVRELPARLLALGLPQVDLVLSGLPVPSLPRELNEVVFDFVGSQPAGTWFSQLTLLPWLYLKLYQGLFELVDFELVPASLPPGGVYHGRWLRPDWRQRVPGKAPAAPAAVEA
ncbi:MAG: methyltransferase domain-containing protein [Fimbriimonadaceae bacterium]|nr:methyltransferase domain-containing protein [Fimbriimonadaceae bacterium]